MRTVTRKFLLVAAAFACGLTGAIFFLREPTFPLTASVLAAARSRWESANPGDYDLSYRMHGARYSVVVRKDVVVEARMNGEILHSAEVGLYSMAGLFNILRMEVENVADANPPPAMRVRFDPADGHVVRYLRGSSGLGRSTSIKVESFTPRPSAAPP